LKSGINLFFLKRRTQSEPISNRILTGPNSQQSEPSDTSIDAITLKRTDGKPNLTNKETQLNGDKVSK
jgi:hypothetical protein